MTDEKNDEMVEIWFECVRCGKDSRAEKEPRMMLKLMFDEGTKEGNC